MQLWVHNISHDRDAPPVKRPHLQRLLDIQTRIAFVAVERCFAFISQLPQKAIDAGSFLGFDRRNAAAAKAQVIIVQNSLSVDSRVRTAVAHLIQIDIAAVSKIQWFFHRHSSSIVIIIAALWRCFKIRSKRLCCFCSRDAGQLDFYAEALIFDANHRCSQS